MHCTLCGGILLRLQQGGCGGYGSYHRCTQCGQVFEQTTGGIVATPGGETYRPLDEHEIQMHFGQLPTVAAWLAQLHKKADKVFRGK